MSNALKNLCLWTDRTLNRGLFKAYKLTKEEYDLLDAYIGEYNKHIIYNYTLGVPPAKIMAILREYKMLDYKTRVDDYLYNRRFRGEE